MDKKLFVNRKMDGTGLNMVSKETNGRNGKNGLKMQALMLPFCL